MSTITHPLAPGTDVAIGFLRDAVAALAEIDAKADDLPAVVVGRVMYAKARIAAAQGFLL